MMTLMPGQRDARPKVTFPVADCHRPLAGTKLYRLMTDAEGANYYTAAPDREANPRPFDHNTDPPPVASPRRVSRI